MSSDSESTSISDYETDNGVGSFNFDKRVQHMDSLCEMNKKGKSTFEGLSKQQWVNLLLQYQPDFRDKKKEVDALHMVEIAKILEGRDSDSDLESVDSDKSYEYDGKKVRGSELYEIWDKEYKEGKKKFNKKEGKKPIQKKKKASTKMSAWEKFLFTNRTNLPAAKYNEHLQLEGWKLDKPVQFKNNSNQLVYKVIEFGTFDKKPKWVKHGTQEWQDGTYY